MVDQIEPECPSSPVKAKEVLQFTWSLRLRVNDSSATRTLSLSITVHHPRPTGGFVRWGLTPKQRLVGVLYHSNWQSDIFCEEKALVKSNYSCIQLFYRIIIIIIKVGRQHKISWLVGINKKGIKTNLKNVAVTQGASDKKQNPRMLENYGFLRFSQLSCYHCYRKDPFPSVANKATHVQNFTIVVSPASSHSC